MWVCTEHLQYLKQRQKTKYFHIHTELFPYGPRINMIWKHTNCWQALTGTEHNFVDSWTKLFKCSLFGQNGKWEFLICQTGIILERKYNKRPNEFENKMQTKVHGRDNANQAHFIEQIKICLPVKMTSNKKNEERSGDVWADVKEWRPWSPGRCHRCPECSSPHLSSHNTPFFTHGHLLLGNNKTWIVFFKVFRLKLKVMQSLTQDALFSEQKMLFLGGADYSQMLKEASPQVSHNIFWMLYITGCFESTKDLNNELIPVKPWTCRTSLIQGGNLCLSDKGRLLFLSHLCTSCCGQCLTDTPVQLLISENKESWLISGALPQFEEWGWILL